MAKIDTLIDIDINSLFYQLHTTALKAVDGDAAYKDKIDIINFGVDIEHKTFIGAGSFIVIAQHNEKDASIDLKADPDKFKELCENALKLYMTHFAGKKAAGRIGPDTLARLDTPTGVDESSIAVLPLSKLLMEAPTTGSKTSGIGYYVEYDIEIEGQPTHKVWDLTAKFAKFVPKVTLAALKAVVGKTTKTLFGDFFSDMKSFRMKIGGQEYKVGQSVADSLSKVAKGAIDAVTVAGQTFKKAFGKTDIRELDENFAKELRNQFTNSTANPTIYKVDTLLTMLRKAKRLDASISNKLMNNGRVFRMEYVITLQVGKSDENYPQYDIPTLHKCFVRAIKQTKGLTLTKNIAWDQFFSENDIIKVDDFENALGIAKLKRPSSPIESLQAKNEFLRLVLDSKLLYESPATDNMLKRIIEILKSDGSDPSKELDEYKLRRLARSILAMKDDYFDAQLKTTTYSTKDLTANAFKDATTVAELKDVLDAFDSDGNLEELLDHVKRLFGSNSDKTSSATSTIGDLYIFCLTNVIRKTDEEKAKETASKKEKG